MNFKRELVIYFDIGLIGTFVAWEKATDDNYRYLKYVPLDSRLKQVVTYEKPIPVSAIHNVDPVLQMKGIPDRLIYIYTEESGSIAKRVLESDYKKQLQELQAKVKSLEMKNTALTQEVENARAGMSKSISSARALVKKPSEENRQPGFGLYNRFGDGGVNDSSNEFDFD